MTLTSVVNVDAEGRASGPTGSEVNLEPIFQLSVIIRTRRRTDLLRGEFSAATKCFVSP